MKSLDISDRVLALVLGVGLIIAVVVLGRSHSLTPEVAAILSVIGTSVAFVLRGDKKTSESAQPKDPPTATGAAAAIVGAGTAGALLSHLASGVLW